MFTRRPGGSACAACRLRLWSRGLDVLDDRVDLPSIAVGIREPELVLKRVARGWRASDLLSTVRKLSIHTPKFFQTALAIAFVSPAIAASFRE